MSPDNLQRAIDNYQAKQAEAQSPKLQMIESTAARLEATELEKTRLLKAYTSGVLSLDDIAIAKTELDKRAADLTQALSQLRSALTPTVLSVENIDRIKKDAADMRQGLLLADDDPHEQRRILDLLLTECRLITEDGCEFVEVNCILGPSRLSTEFVISYN